jgi:hypothetical protein
MLQLLTQDKPWPHLPTKKNEKEEGFMRQLLRHVNLN